MNAKRAAVCLALLASALWSSTANAHTRSSSYSTWTVADIALVQLTLTDLDASALVGANPSLAGPGALAAHIVGAFELTTERGHCQVDADSIRTERMDRGARTVRWRLWCPSSSATELRSSLLFDVVPGHVHYVRIHSGKTVLDSVLDAGTTAVRIDAVSQQSVRRFVSLGIEHIATGWDHLVFILALVVIAGSLRRLAIMLTGFTVGHTLALFLAATGTAAPTSGVIELLIALSIGVVSVENVWLSGRRDRWLPVGLWIVATGLLFASAASGGASLLTVAGSALFLASYLSLVGTARDPLRWRVVIAALFGIVHGFGFAGVLSQLGSGSVIAPLVSFNVGVEIGQLAIVALAWPVILLIRRWGRGEALVVTGSAIALALACYWAVCRLGG